MAPRDPDDDARAEAHRLRNTATLLTKQRDEAHGVVYAHLPDLLTGEPDEIEGKP